VIQKPRRPSAEQLNVLRWLVTAVLAVTYIFTGFEPALYLGVAVLLAPALLRMTSFRDRPKGPR
jgi:hypothetical protein